MPIARTPEQVQETHPVSPRHEAPAGIAAFEWQGIPIDVCRHFNVELGTIPTKDLEQLKEITEWAKLKTADEPSIGNILQKIAGVQRQLGTPALNEKAYSKVWQFIKAQRVIDEMTKRQESLRGSAWL
jgi:hypothetical protein